MNRREFSAGVAGGLAVAAMGGSAMAQAPARLPEEGIEYLELSRPVPVEAPPGKVEVVEFFWYSCPHCNAFEPRLQAWIKKMPADVTFKRVPVAFRQDFVPQQRLFYTLEIMGRLDDMHVKVFHALHDQNLPINRDDTIVAWAEQQGLDRAKFMEVYASFGVLNKVRRAIQLQDAFKVQGVPSLAIAGRYYTDATLAGSMDRALQITDYLIGEARKAR